MASVLSGSGVRQAVVASAAREWRYLRSSPWDFALATWVPCTALAILVWLFTSGVPRGVPIAVVDEDHGAVSRSLVRALKIGRASCRERVYSAV